MNILQLINYDNLACPVYNLVHDAQVGDDTLKLNSVEQLQIGSKLILSRVHSPVAQLVTVTGITGTTVGIDPVNRYFREENDVLAATMFDQFKVYFGASPDINQHTALTTLNMVINRNTTFYVDTNALHTPSTFYSFTYYNSTNQNESNRIPVISSGLDTEITPQYLKENYLYGLDLTEDNGQPLPEGVYWEGIKAGFSWMEGQLQMDILQKTYVDEPSDFRSEEYLQWGFIKTKHFPIREVTRILGAYYSNNIEFPTSWARVKAAAGIINLVPGDYSSAKFIIPAAGGIPPILNNRMSHIPGFWKISYTTGFNKGEIPYDIRDVICKKAAFMPLNTLGDLTGGVGVSSKSLGIDGLSQSMVYTGSAENAGYSARLRMYMKEIDQDLGMLKSRYRPISFACV